MPKKFELKDFIHFAYLSVIAVVLSVAMAVLINISITLINYALNQSYQPTAFDYYVYLFGISFIYLMICHPHEKPVSLEEPQAPDFFSLSEEVEMVYLLVGMLEAKFIHEDSVIYINDYLETYLNDDTLFMDMSTREILAMLKQLLSSGRLSLTNRYLANKRLDLMVKELMALDRLNKKELEKKDWRF